MSRTIRTTHTHWLRHPKHLGSRRASASIPEDEEDAGMSLGKIHQPPDAWEDKPVASRREIIRR
jgi:hypothetical protein